MYFVYLHYKENLSTDSINDQYIEVLRCGFIYSDIYKEFLC